MTPLFVDSSVLLLAMGIDHPLRRPCMDILAAAHRGECQLHVSAEGIQEVVHHRLRRGGRAEAVADAADTMALCAIHEINSDVLHRMLDLVATTHLRGRDAIHAGTAAMAGFDHIVSPDVDFDNVPGLRRIHPPGALTV